MALPESTFGGKYLHKSIPEMAAAYAFHLCENHPFIDGNERAALAASLVFLDIDGFDFNCSEDELYGTMISVAKGEMKKVDLAAFYKAHSKRSRSSLRSPSSANGT